MLVFAFVPVLVAVPQWVAFEVTNPLNRHDPVVASFVLVRGVNLLLAGFRAHVAPGVVAGALDALLVAAWLAWDGRASTAIERLVLGGVAGLGAAGLTVVLTPGVGLAFEMTAGLVCGIISVPGAVGFLARPGPRPGWASATAG